MTRPTRDMDARESRLDELRDEARRTGRVTAPGARIEGGPLPGYYGRPVVKPPVWTWEVPLYFFVGGLAGMASVLALAATIADLDAALEGAGEIGRLVRAARWLAAAGAAVAPILLILDLGRPARFLNMLRVFKWRSPMSVGAWVLAAYGGAAWIAAVAPWAIDRWGAGPLPVVAWEGIALAATAGAGLLGAALATYTGVLLGATAIPAWFAHHKGLPVHFGVAGLGSAAAALELLGFRVAPLHAIGLAAAAIETGFGAWIELHRHGPVDRALREGPSGLLLRGAGFLAGPTALALRLVGLVPWAAGAFLVGALLSRYGWVAAGHASGRDPEATFAAQR
ncbi:MAG: NrfD/PsrC family molybdoenzyme membrane anchor subunit [Gemmatimonadota bacterium]